MARPAPWIVRRRCTSTRRSPVLVPPLQVLLNLLARHPRQDGDQRGARQRECPGGRAGLRPAERAGDLSERPRRDLGRQLQQHGERLGQPAPMVGGAELLRPAARRPGLHHPRGRAGPDPRRLRRRAERRAAADGRQQRRGLVPVRQRGRRAGGRLADGRPPTPAGPAVHPQPGGRRRRGRPRPAGPRPPARAPIGPDVRPGHLGRRFPDHRGDGGRRDPGPGGASRSTRCPSGLASPSGSATTAAP